MSLNHIKAFDKTLQTTNEWLADIQHELRWTDRQKAYQALRAVLHALRDCLIVEEAADLGAQLPMLVRGIYYEGWVPAKVPVRRDLESFLDEIRNAFRGEPKLDVDWVVRGVFRTVTRHVTPGELRDVKHILPTQLQALWPDALS